MPISEERDIEVKRGRDDAYAEFYVDKMDELIDSIVSGKNQPIKHLVLKSGSVTLSDYGQIQSFKNVISDICNTEDAKVMTKKQIGFFVFKRIFEKGLEFWS